MAEVRAPMRSSGQLASTRRSPLLLVAVIAVVVVSAITLSPKSPAHAQDATGHIAFVSDRDGNNEIYVMNADGSDQTNLTNNLANDNDLTWSPDGTKIAFTSDRDGNGEIYVMNADGSNPTNLTNHAAPDSDPNWSPDGNLIAFVTGRDGDGEIYLMNADGSGQTNLSNNPETSNDPDRVSGRDVSPTWSPDGSRIAFWSSAQTSAGVVGENIYVVNADGSGRAALTGVVTSDIRIGPPAWAPDSERIAYHTGFTLSQGYADFASRSIGVIHADGTPADPFIGASNLETSTPSVTFPAWSPDGSRIAFLSYPDGSINAIDGSAIDKRPTVFVMNADGSGRTGLSSTSALNISAPVWSLDGNRIAFVSDQDGNTEIYAVNDDGSGQTRLTNNPANDSSPAWSPLQIAEPTPTPEPVAPTAEPVEPAPEPPAPEDTGPPQTEFVESVPGPNEISTDPEVVGSNIVLTLVVILVFGFSSALFNQTLASNRGDIEGWVGRLFRPVRRASNFVEQQYGAVAGRQPWVQRLAGPALILLLTGLVYGNLSSEPEFDSKTAVLFISMVVAVGVATYVFAGGEALFTRRILGLDAGVKLYAVAVAIAVGFVLFSRLVEFQPGFMFGFVASFTLLTPAALGRERDGQAALFPAVALLLVSLIAWVLLIPLREVESTNAWAGLPEGTAAVMVVAGLEGVFFSMIPLSFMHGARIAQWNRVLWLLMFGLSGFLFWHVLLNQEGTLLEAFEETRIRVIAALLSSYFVATLAIWAYFRGRTYGWSVPALIRGQSTAQPGLKQSVPMPVFLATIALAGAAIIAIGVLAFVLTGGGDDDSSVVAGAGTPTVAAAPSQTAPAATIAATPTTTVAIDRSTCDQGSEVPALAQELATIREQGYVVCDTTTYLPGGAIHVLVGVLEASSDSFTQLAFFFVGGEYLGTDSISPSVSITVISQISNTVTLSYAMFRPDDQACCPSAGNAEVPYYWDGTRLTPMADIPPTEGPISRR